MWSVMASAAILSGCGAGGASAKPASMPKSSQLDVARDFARRHFPLGSSIYQAKAVSVLDHGTFSVFPSDSLVKRTKNAVVIMNPHTREVFRFSSSASVNAREPMIQTVAPNAPNVHVDPSAVEEVH